MGAHNQSNRRMTLEVDPADVAAVRFSHVALSADFLSLFAPDREPRAGQRTRVVERVFAEPTLTTTIEKVNGKSAGTAACGYRLRRGCGQSECGLRSSVRYQRPATRSPSSPGTQIARAFIGPAGPTLCTTLSGGFTKPTMPGFKM